MNNHSGDGWSHEENKLLEDLLESQIDDGWTSEDNKLVGDLREDLEVIESPNNGSRDIVKEDNGGPSKKRRVTKKPRAKPIPWTEDEHKLFLLGLQRFGKGKWKAISKFYVHTKTPSQIASHAQKFNKRIDNPTPLEKRRRSINDIWFVEEDFDLSTYSQPSSISPPPNVQQNYAPRTIQPQVLNNINPQIIVSQNFVPPNFQHVAYNQPNFASPPPIMPQNYVPHTIQHPVLHNINPQPTMSQNFVPNFQYLAQNQMQQSIIFPENYQ
ncbi:hypothetical protein ACET3Z_015159 [Daucus carota]